MRKISFVLLLALGLISFAVSAQESASGILDKAVAKINKNSSAECKFTVKSGNQSLNGSLSVAGKKFKLSTPQGTTWYDGQSMWTANPSSKEITLVNPSAQEVRESNPFEYLNTYKSQYKVFFSKYKSNDSYLIVLNPKAAKSDIKAVQIDIDKKTLLPRKFTIRDRNDRRTIITINSLSLKTGTKASNFVCPVSSMSDYEVVDLR